ncbi:MAG: CpaF family protein [Ardenticatenaceae bacterium]|nr:CpaF family protein [Anaerolineales bacterium]MCB8923950.1 CpaF family protein [Ardenticatenaceae bacterium]MCB8990149.1 CpaF family protein [Ardenticatenaceae bacterium]MCB9005456.1 CpaF family protein [Ardenticatenaceae bacterium]
MNETAIMKALAPLQPLLDDPHVAEIMVDGYDSVYIERQEQFEDIPTPFRDNQHLTEVIQQTAVALGHPLGAGEWMLDGRLPNGSRFNAVLPPVAILGPSLIIRKFAARSLTFDDLIRFGSLNQLIIDFLRACVEGRLNIVISGGTGSGKTTVLNLVTSLIPPNERVVTVENAAELRPSPALKRIVRMESQPGNASGEGAISMRDLVVNALRMRPDRLIIGEVRGGEALDVFQALNTGHDGSMFSMHAGGVHDALTRLETMVYMAMPSLPLLQVRQQMAAAIDVILHQERMRDGRRKILRVAEVVGMQGDAILVQDIFKFQETGMENGRILGQHIATGYIPTFVKKMRAANVSIPMSLFTPQ